MADIDSVNLRLLRMLVNDAHASLKKMSREVGLSITGVQRRIERLEKLGIIKQYSAVIDPKKYGYGVSAFVSVEVGSRGLSDLVKSLKTKHEVCELHMTTGSRPLLVKIRAKDNEGLKKFVEENITSSDYVKGATTTVAMETFKETFLNP